MAKQGSWLIGLILVLSIVSPGLAQQAYRDWGYFAPVELQGGNIYKAVYLTEMIYEYARPDLADLRLVDASGKLVPYYLQNGSAAVRHNQVVYQARLIDWFEKAGDSYFDYQVTMLQDNSDTVGTALIFTLPARNFLKYAEVFGSHDGLAWQYLTKDYLYKADGREKNSLILGNRYKYRYYRVKLLANAENIVPGSMQLVDDDYRQTWASLVKTKELDYSGSERNNETIITVKNPHKLHIHKLILTIGGNFQRNYSVYSDIKQTKLLQNGELYNLQLQGVDISHKAIAFDPPVAAETIIIKINNRQNQPLPVKGVQAEYIVDKVVFPDTGNGPYRLYFGNAAAEKPQFDIELQKKYIEKEPQDDCKMQEKQQNQPNLAVSAIRPELLLNAVIVGVSLLLVVVLATKLKCDKS